MNNTNTNGEINQEKICVFSLVMNWPESGIFTCTGFALAILVEKGKRLTACVYWFVTSSEAFQVQVLLTHVFIPHFFVAFSRHFGCFSSMFCSRQQSSHANREKPRELLIKVIWKSLIFVKLSSLQLSETSSDCPAARNLRSNHNSALIFGNVEIFFRVVSARFLQFD
jgi:hypothetical protein